MIECKRNSGYASIAGEHTWKCCFRSITGHRSHHPHFRSLLETTTARLEMWNCNSFNLTSQTWVTWQHKKAVLWSKYWQGSVNKAWMDAGSRNTSAGRCCEIGQCMLDNRRDGTQCMHRNTRDKTECTATHTHNTCRTNAAYRSEYQWLQSCAYTYIEYAAAR